MGAFADYEDLGTRLKRTFNADEQTWITSLLEDASAHLREVIGQEVCPETISTFTAYPDAGRIDLPQWPVVSIGLVQRGGVDITYRFRPNYLTVDCDDPVEVTFTWGYATVPDELKRLACVLVSQALLPLEQELGLTAGGLSSVAIDDFKAAWADAGASSGMVLTPASTALVQSRYGRGGVHVVETGR